MSCPPLTCVETYDSCHPSSDKEVTSRHFVLECFVLSLIFFCWLVAVLFFPQVATLLSVSPRYTMSRVLVRSPAIVFVKARGEE